jgi:hypothetical protein
MTRHGVDVVVKLNPTLLGHPRVKEIVNDTLDYDYVQLDPKAFDDDLQFDRGVELIGELREFAAPNGRRFGIKLTNTLVVRNHKGFMPDDPMYLSGAPLHVLATTLLGELSAALPGVLQPDGGDVQVSFSAGVTRDNVSETVGLGVAPATICSDLLKPGGYGRLAPMLKRLAEDMRSAGATTLEAWRGHRTAEAVGAGHHSAVEHHVSRMLAGDELGRLSPRSQREIASPGGPRAADVGLRRLQLLCDRLSQRRLLPSPHAGGQRNRWPSAVSGVRRTVQRVRQLHGVLSRGRRSGDRQAAPLPRSEPFRTGRGTGVPGRAGPSGLDVEPKPGWDREMPMLLRLLTAEEGLPVRAGDLS